MKKIYLLAAFAFASLGVNAQQHLAIEGGDFEDFPVFEGHLNSYGLLEGAVQGIGEGVDGTNSLSLDMNKPGNKYVFTALAPEGLPSDITEISFMVKGTSPSKSLSVNIYKAESGYYKFNMGELTTSATFDGASSNQYTGLIDTNGEWVKVTLNLNDISDYNTDPSKGFLALKIGKNSDYAIDVDNFEYVSESMGTVALDFGAKSQVVLDRGTLVITGVDAKAITVFNTQGQKVASSTNVATLPAGVYFVQILSKEGKVSTAKFIKK